MNTKHTPQHWEAPTLKEIRVSAEVTAYVAILEK
ncbi:coenzyme PQQ precursor peptide PqqA [Psychromicrobium silvestre]|uniref:Coenzyme PQQ synthesis protein A n=1 Tax=Psychromicrobium silvestre TaxID=1645614 RepID=A0A7Y9LTQ4_9MICC|nr:pyrroloquinoline quinone precursor peptide PqqA [Psychromicrobium silvestre]NYE95463.1 coenzyme PQQ precursor peptide PqqA [Psychromicrobium silvestre]NYE95469.1 coenzyme PQQ precursor peptide PqqA [Psychromicrobium silvestre]